MLVLFQLPLRTASHLLYSVIPLTLPLVWFVYVLTRSDEEQSCRLLNTYGRFGGASILNVKHSYGCRPWIWSTKILSKSIFTNQHGGVVSSLLSESQISELQDMLSVPVCLSVWKCSSLPPRGAARRGKSCAVALGSTVEVGGEINILNKNWFSALKVLFFIFVLWHHSPRLARAASFLRFLDRTQWHITVGRTPLDEGSARLRNLYLTTHNTRKKETSMPPGGIRTRNPCKRSAADSRLRPLGHWDWQKFLIN